MRPDDEALILPSKTELDALRAWVERSSDESRIPFAESLSPDDLRRFRSDLRTVLTESDGTGEPVDALEIADIFREFADLARWEGAPWPRRPESELDYRIDVPSGQWKTLRSAPAAVRRVVDDLFVGPLRRSPAALRGEIPQRIKKLPDRDIWQVYLPDGFRLRYLVDEPDRTVHVVYLGPHSDSRNDGRESAVKQAIHRKRRERRRELE